MPNQFENLAHPDSASSVTPDDSANLTNHGILYIGGAGDVAVTTSGGSEVTFTGLSAGSFLPVIVAKVKATGTTATNILVTF